VQLTGLLPVIRRWWLMILAATFVAGCVGLVVASLVAPTYEAEVRLLVGPLNTDVNTLRASGQLARTYAEIATSEPLLAATTERLETPRVVAADVEVDASADEVTRILTVIVRHKDRAAVAAIANGLAEQLKDRVDTDIVRPEGELQVVDAARPPDGPVAPRVGLTGMFAAVAGLLIAVTLVLVFEFLTPMVRTVDQLEGLRPEVPVIGALDRISRRLRSREGVAAPALGSSPNGATYALAAARVTEVAHTKSPVVLVLGASLAGQASQVAINLAATLAAQGRRPVLVEADRTSGATTAMAIDQRVAGLTDELGPGSSSDVRLVRVDLGRGVHIDVLPYGSAQELSLTPTTAAPLINALRAHSDVVIIEAAPVARSPESMVWATLADASLLVVQRNRDRLDEVGAAIDLLLSGRAPLCGILFDETVLAPQRRMHQRDTRDPSTVVGAADETQARVTGGTAERAVPGDRT
jgi:capsular polysaccharide biosynthesis protein/Mrp family chromosome partitioning ATPase